MYKAEDSHFWSELMRVKSLFLSLGVFTLKNDEQIRFWEHKWLGNQPSCFSTHFYTKYFGIKVPQQLMFSDPFLLMCLFIGL
jgi:hypothetical protein